MNLMSEPIIFESTTQDNHDPFTEMVIDAAGPEFDWNTRNEPERSNPTAEKFFKLKDAADSPLWSGCEDYSELSALLQRLYTSKTTAEHMRWHKESLGEEGKLLHPRDGEAWKHFDGTHPTFAVQTRNVGVHMFLLLDHPYRYQKDNFTKGRIETDSSIIRLTGEELEVAVASLPNIEFGKTKEKERIEGFGETHNWLKRSIFWDLPYWRANLIRHNLDVMHIEKNMFDNVFNTVMDVNGKTKDNVNARLDLQNICKRRDLELKEVNGKYIKPKASYTLTKEERLMVLKWIKNLRLPDGYASNLARCVNLDDCSLHGMKSYDCHVFMERLLPLAFRDLLPEPVWNALTELTDEKQVGSRLGREMVESRVVVWAEYHIGAGSALATGGDIVYGVKSRHMVWRVDEELEDMDGLDGGVGLNGKESQVPEDGLTIGKPGHDRRVTDRANDMERLKSENGHPRNNWRTAGKEHMSDLEDMTASRNGEKRCRNGDLEMDDAVDMEAEKMVMSRCEVDKKSDHHDRDHVHDRSPCPDSCAHGSHPE
ncbi:hypothetical protein BUALT_Bualt14G0054400 [Buddleja alternifolia]|uniref:Uncharacterized protein n=1 Tax=Buddleja alternifolia TaxID=168488 RepID=A0AAV6WPR8_9LAMI|nr:hypothetical protein BUALT_Bualt14G0054400 [Buddleja alternifolia]